MVSRDGSAVEDESATKSDEGYDEPVWGEGCG